MAGKALKVGKEKIFLMSLLKKIDKLFLLSSKFFNNERKFLQHVFIEVIRLIDFPIFNVLCLRFYFPFQILNLLLIFSCSLEVFSYFKS